MHPPLAEHQHDGCLEVMRALNQCHSDHPLMKALGVCNDQKHALNMCLRAERVDRAKRNADAAKLKRAATEAKWKQIEAES